MGAHLTAKREAVPQNGRNRGQIRDLADMPMPQIGDQTVGNTKGRSGQSDQSGTECVVAVSPQSLCVAGKHPQAN
jgi:hypothetical protein